MSACIVEKFDDCVRKNTLDSCDILFAVYERCCNPIQPGLEDVAFFVNRLSDFIYFCSLKLYRLVADGADGECTLGGEIGTHGHLRPLGMIMRLHKRPTPEKGSGGGMCKTCLKTSTKIDAGMY
jgi:hypothetical protein